MAPEEVSDSAPEQDEDPLQAIRALDSIEALVAQPHLAKAVLEEFFDGEGLQLTDSYTVKQSQKDKGKTVTELIPLRREINTPALVACLDSTRVDVGDSNTDYFIEAFEEISGEDPTASELTIGLVQELDQARNQAINKVKDGQALSREYLLRLRLIVWHHIFDKLADQLELEPEGNGDDEELPGTGTDG